MAAGTHDLDLCQGSDEPHFLQYLDERGIGFDLLSAPYTIRMQIREPDRNGTIILDLTETPNANGSLIELEPDLILGPDAITTFVAGNVLIATGAGFVLQLADVQYDDEGVPQTPTLITSAVARLGDIVRIAGSTSNDGDKTLKTLTDADTLEALEALAVEAALGTVSIIRQGLIKITITNADTVLFDFDTAEFDIEIVSADVTPIVTRIIQGPVTLDGETTK